MIGKSNCRHGTARSPVGPFYFFKHDIRQGSRVTMVLLPHRRLPIVLSVGRYIYFIDKRKNFVLNY